MIYVYIPQHLKSPDFMLCQPCSLAGNEDEVRAQRVTSFLESFHLEMKLVVWQLL